MIANLRQALKSSGGRDHLGVTLSMPHCQCTLNNVFLLSY